MSTLEVSNLNYGTTTVASTYVTNGSAKVIVRYNMSGAIQGTSMNVSSVTDSGGGRQSPQFTNAFSDANYVCMATVTDTLGVSNHGMIVNQDNSGTVSASETRIGIVDGDDGNAYSDAEFANVSLFGDLA